MNNVQAPNSRRVALSAGPLSRSDPRADQREKLIAAAKTAIAAQGLGGLRARDLAADIGCSVGAIYNLVADLDELVLRVGQGTMAELNACLNEAARGVIERDEAIRGAAVRHLASLGLEARGLDVPSLKPAAAPTPATDPTEDPASLFVAWALAYAAFAAANRERWRALFDFRLAQGKDLPDWFEADQTRLFVRIEERLAALLPGLDAAAVQKRARTLFSAVHGIVTLGLEGKLVAWPAAPIEAELEAFIRTYVAGLIAERADR